MKVHLIFTILKFKGTVESFANRRQNKNKKKKKRDMMIDEKGELNSCKLIDQTWV